MPVHHPDFAFGRRGQVRYFYPVVSFAKSADEWAPIRNALAKLPELAGLIPFQQAPAIVAHIQGAIGRAGTPYGAGWIGKTGEAGIGLGGDISPLPGRIFVEARPIALRNVPLRIAHR